MKWRHLKTLVDGMSEERLDQTASIVMPAYGNREFKMAALLEREDLSLQGEGAVLVAEMDAAA